MFRPQVKPGLALFTPASEAFEKLIVIGVRADPEPDHDIALEYTDHSVIATDARGDDGLASMDTLEPEAPLARIAAELRLRLSR